MDDELYHYGVKGMKWGIRRTPEQLGHKTSSVRKTVGSAAKAVGSAGKKVAGAVSSAHAAQKQKKAEEAEVKKQKELKKKPLSEWSDDELQTAIKRLQLEKQYKDLAGSDSVKKGESRVKKILLDIGESSARNLGEQLLDSAGGDLINLLFGVESDDELHRMVNPRKRQTQKKK